MNGHALNELYRINHETLRLELLGDQLIIECGGANAVSIQAEIDKGAWGSAVLTVMRSNDGNNPYALASPTTISSSGITSITPDTQYLHVVVTTAGSANNTVNVTAYSRLS